MGEYLSITNRIDLNLINPKPLKRILLLKFCVYSKKDHRNAYYYLVAANVQATILQSIYGALASTTKKNIKHARQNSAKSIDF